MIIQSVIKGSRRFTLIDSQIHADETNQSFFLRKSARNHLLYGRMLKRGIKGFPEEVPASQKIRKNSRNDVLSHAGNFAPD